ncbi:hypothetical protein NBRC110019_23220 [Neptunitalea chrysea]|uniref:Lipoprotein n=1 Tax=Neptunitalea chrysea TaxID=1647581 RepID=A0A9W6B7K1_9FLAO|nr:hypothetical protein [Neptunitalea chrysea]GLB53282.1 hypothetical protein NBRC110019_23220 [Neptunitalea chrysea]
MKKYTLKISIIVIIISLVITSCASDAENEFLITKDQVGLLTPTTHLDELETIFAKDSVSESAYEGELRYASTERFEIFDKTGAPLLEITPAKDSIHTIRSIKIISPKYYTKSGITVNSTFKDIKKQYPISSIDNLWTSVVIHVNDLNAHFTIDKKNLDPKFLKNTLYDVTENDIPETAPIKYFMIGWY